MEQRLQNRLRMLTNTLGHFADHPDLWNGHPPIVRNVDALRAARGRMASAAETQEGSDSQGLTANKQAARTDAATRLTRLGRKVSAYALEAGDEDLRRAVDHSQSEWERMAEATFASRATNALDRIAALSTELAEYGVTDDEATAAREAVAEVGRLAERRDNTGATREVATGDIGEAYSDDAVPALDKLDRLVPALIEDEAFVDTYEEVRQILGD